MLPVPYPSHFQDNAFLVSKYVNIKTTQYRGDIATLYCWRAVGSTSKAIIEQRGSILCKVSSPRLSLSPPLRRKPKSTGLWHTFVRKNSTEFCELNPLHAKCILGYRKFLHLLSFRNTETALEVEIVLVENRGLLIWHSNVKWLLTKKAWKYNELITMIRFDKVMCKMIFW